MAFTTVHHPVRKLSVPAAVLGGLAATIVGVATVAVVVDRADATGPVEQVAAPAQSGGLGFVFSDAFPSEVVAPSPATGLGYVLSDEFPSEVVAAVAEPAAVDTPEPNEPLSLLLDGRAFERAVNEAIASFMNGSALLDGFEFAEAIKIEIAADSN